VKTLYLRIYATVVAVLLLFALVAGWLLQRNIERERERFQASAVQRVTAWAELLQNALPPPTAPSSEQAAELLDWSQRLRLPMALDDAAGRRIAVAPDFDRWTDPATGPPFGAERRAPQRVVLSDGRVLWFARAPRPRGGGGPDGGMRAEPPPFLPGPGLLVALGLLFIAVAAGAWPVVRRLTRRLDALKQGVEAFGAGALHHRVAEDGRDEVAALGASFNRAAARIEALLRSQQSLLANASHELRSPLARLKMAVSMLEDAPAGLSGTQRDRLRQEIHTNIGELDALVEEVLLASRLESGATLQRNDAVDLLALAAEEGSRIQAGVEGQTVQVSGDERLLRRALRNLLENAHRYGVDAVSVSVRRSNAGQAEVLVCDRGPGVPEPYRERIFEPFFRLPGHAEREGGVGLGLALVRQIAVAHGGSVRCEPREGGGSCFRLSLPVA